MNSSCTEPAITQHVPDPPYDNSFHSDCQVSTQAVVTSPLPNSNLAIIGPRFIVAWPAANSGIGLFFAPQNGIDGVLAIELVNSTIGSLASTYQDTAGSAVATVGVTGILKSILPTRHSSVNLPVSVHSAVMLVCAQVFPYFQESEQPFLLYRDS